MALTLPIPRGPNGGYAGKDPKYFYDPMDTRRPAVDIAAPTEEDVEVFHLAPETTYPAGTDESHLRRIDVTCIGTGMAGITVAMLAQWRLKNVQLKIFEKNDKPTGTWYENKYPGCRCDLAAHFYVWRWEPNPLWTQDYVESDAIESYFARMSHKYNVSQFAHFSTTVTSATWSDIRQAWKLTILQNGVEKEEWTHVLINGHGVLNRPKVPEFEGEKEYKGVVMHTARFDREVPLEGKKVAVIGNGSSGIQTIGTIGRKVGELHSYQRSLTWITNQLGTLDQLDAHVFTPSELEFYSRRQNAYDFFKRSWTGADAGWPRFILGSPMQVASTMMAKQNLEKLVKDPKLREMLTPTYPVGCRRNTPHEHYFDVLQLPTTTIIRSPIERFTERGIVAGGVERECDMIIKATGFNVSYIPAFPVTGRNGVTLSKLWADFPFTYKSIMSSGFPNYFHIMGPNAPVASNSIHMFEEQQISYAIQVIQKLQTTTLVSIHPNPSIESAWNQKIQAGLKCTIWNIDCGGWYRHPSGVLTSHYPGPSTSYMDEIRNPEWGDMEVVRLEDMQDPKLNEITPQFGADVEKVAQIGPPREPRILDDRGVEIGIVGEKPVGDGDLI